MRSNSELRAFVDNAEVYRPAGGNGAGGNGDDAAPKVLSAAAFIAGFVAPDFIVDGLLQRGYLYALTGRTGEGKTACALSLAVALASGQAFGGRETERGRVVFLAGENPDDVRARFIMTCEYFGVDLRTVDVHFVAGVFDIQTSLEILRAKVEAIGGAALIIVDTLAAYFGGDDENSNVQLGDFARQLRALCGLPGRPAVVANAHPIKSARGKSDLLPRGGGAFLAEVDGNLTAYSEDKETVEVHWTGKLRGPGFEPLAFRLERRTSSAVADAKGRLIQSIVAVPMGETDVQKAQSAQLSEQDHVLETMLHHSRGSLATWCEHMGWMNAAGEPLKAKMQRRLSELVEAGLATKVRGGRYALTRKGRAEAERVSGVSA